MDDAEAEPERYLLGLCERVRLGEIDPPGAAHLAPDVAAAVAAVLRRRQPLGCASLDAAGVVLHAAGEQRAIADLGRLRSMIADNSTSLTTDGDVAAVAVVERQVTAGATLFPSGIPSPWHGHDFEAHGLIAGPASRLSLAVRWHGAEPAQLWEVTGGAVTLRAAAGTQQ